jgi:hypothetical protein
VRSFTTRAVPPILLVDDDDNSPDVRSYYTAALGVLGMDADVWYTGNSDNEPDAATLSTYSTVIWFTGDEFGGAAGPGAAGETALAQWLDGPGSCLLVSGQDYLWDRGVTGFVQGYLGVSAVDNDVHQSSVTGEGSVFAGMGPFVLSYPFTDYADRLTVTAEAEVDFTGLNGIAAAGRRASWGMTTLLSFPLEALPTAADRSAVLGAFLGHCAEASATVFADDFESGATGTWSSTIP